MPSFTEREREREVQLEREGKKREGTKERSACTVSDALEAGGNLRLAGAYHGADGDRPLGDDAEDALLSDGAEAGRHLRSGEPAEHGAALALAHRRPHGHAADAQQARAGAQLDSVARAEGVRWGELGGRPRRKALPRRPWRRLLRRDDAPVATGDQGGRGREKEKEGYTEDCGRHGDGW